MIYGEISGVKLGDGYPVKVMGIINASRESFYKRSVKETSEEIAAVALKMVEEGASIIDVGGMSTAPYIQTEISIAEEISRLKMAIGAIRSAVKVPISADTPRSESAEAAIEAGASIVNDVSGLKRDPAMKEIICKKNASAILMAHEILKGSGSPIDRIKSALEESLKLAKTAGIAEEKIILDPGLGFFRKGGGGFGFSPSTDIPWYVWDCTVIRELGKLESLGKAFCVSISRKSFIGKILSLESADDRLAGSLAGTAIAVYNGAHLIRTHDVAATLQAVKIAEAIKDLTPSNNDGI